MKKLSIYFLFLFFLISCSDEEKTEAEKKISSRDYSITASNSYSTLFLDSMDMEKFILDNKLNDSVTRRMRSFYNTRNFQFAWFSGDGLTEQAHGFWNLHDYVTTYDKDSTLKDKKLKKRMEALIYEGNFSISSPKNYINTELTLTQHFIQYILNNFEKGFVKRKEMERFIPFKKQDALYLADSLINKRHKDNKYFEDVHEPYRLMKAFLAKYYAIAQQGGWPQVAVSKKTIKKGSSDAGIPLIKKRLQLTGDMPPGDTSQVFTDSLVNGIKSFQQRMGFNPDGIITAELIKEMNVPVIERIRQILMNMGRIRWMPAERSGKIIVVNIPEFVLHLYEGNQKVFDMNVVVGKEGTNTMMFTGDMNQIVFSPYWNVPPSIVKNEILPAMENNPGYLESQNMEQTGTENGLPVIRQRPGARNSLGRVKFLFPNSFNIYLHDTPAKSLFERDKRAYSHGCIRIAEPEKLANYLLKNNSEWTPEKINTAMHSGKERYVRLEDPVPVVITYYTSWVDEQGQLNFRSDVYDHDKLLAQKMFK